MLKKMSSIIALGLVVAFLTIPAAGFAGKGPGDGTGDNLKCLGGTIVDGVCICDASDIFGSITTEENFVVAAGQTNRNDADPICDEPDGDPWWMSQGPNGGGDQDGTPDQERLRDDSCLG